MYLVIKMYSKLKQLRLEKQYTGLYMAREIGVSKVFYYQLESGKRRLSYDNAVKIAKVFNIKPDEIFYEDHLKNNHI